MLSVGCCSRQWLRHAKDADEESEECQRMAGPGTGAFCRGVCGLPLTKACTRYCIQSLHRYCIQSLNRCCIQSLNRYCIQSLNCYCIQSLCALTGRPFPNGPLLRLQVPWARRCSSLSSSSSTRCSLAASCFSGMWQSRGACGHCTAAHLKV